MRKVYDALTHAPIQVTLATQLQKLHYIFNTKTLLYSHKREHYKTIKEKNTFTFVSTACNKVPWMQNYRLRIQNLVDL